MSLIQVYLRGRQRLGNKRLAQAIAVVSDLNYGISHGKKEERQGSDIKENTNAKM